MGHEFEAVDTAAVPASPEQVWEAIATGPGIDSWFMGHTEITADGAVRLDYGPMTLTSSVTAWDPLKRFGHASGRAEDGRFVAYEFLIEGRDSAATTLRMVTSGFIPGDDWKNEFEAMTNGGALFWRTLVTYLTHFAGRAATPITVFGPPLPDMAAAWRALFAELGLSGSPAVGDPVRLSVDGSSVDGVVFSANPQTLGIRCQDAMYRFMQGFFNPTIITGHLVFEPQAPQPDNVWAGWLARVLT
ncbi:SRPBCC domain-containing protein [Streptosporangiaceae bacterium NEAU-GS5]|nr:SRPBCC domain-containing protein [Streptosporangiaceae bacterium NEAU-GS5]